MKVTVTSAVDRCVTITTTIDSLQQLHAALIRKKRTRHDIRLLQELAASLSAGEPELPGYRLPERTR